MLILKADADIGLFYWTRIGLMAVPLAEWCWQDIFGNRKTDKQEREYHGRDESLTLVNPSDGVVGRLNLWSSHGTGVSGFASVSRLCRCDDYR